jgi:hypothetical protein
VLYLLTACLLVVSKNKEKVINQSQAKDVTRRGLNIYIYIYIYINKVILGHRGDSSVSLSFFPSRKRHFKARLVYESGVIMGRNKFQSPVPFVLFFLFVSVGWRL